MLCVDFIIDSFFNCICALSVQQLNEPQQGSSKEPASWAPDTEASSNRPPLPRSLPALKDEKSDTLTATGISTLFGWYFFC